MSAIGKAIRPANWAGFLAACALLLAFVYAEDVAEQALEAGAVYQRLLTTGFDPPYVEDVSIVLIRHDIEPMEVTLVNACEQRRFLARLLVRIAEHGPAVIVIDKYFEPGSCATQVEATAELQTTMQNLLGKGFRIVVGRRSDTDGKMLPALDFANGSQGAVEGEVTFEQDVRRVVFEWDNTLPDGTPIRFKTLALQAALARNPKLLDVNTRLKTFYDRREQPFVGFLPPSAMRANTFSAVQLLCGASAGANADWRHCDTPMRDALEGLRNRVVVVGEDTLGVDQHPTVIGMLPGVLVHAQYIEAILHGPLFRVLPWPVALAYNFLVFALLQWIAERQGGVKRIVFLGLTILGAYGLSWFASKLAGYYVNPGIGLIGAILSWIGSAWASRLQGQPARGAS